MGRLEPYSLGNISLELENFRDSITNLWNYGKYAPPVVTSIPTWDSQPGEFAWISPASGGRTLVVYLNSAWVVQSST